MSIKSERVIDALRELETALEEFRGAYTTWLASDRDVDGETTRILTLALENAQRRLDAARAILATAGGV